MSLQHVEFKEISIGNAELLGVGRNGSVLRVYWKGIQ